MTKTRQHEIQKTKRAEILPTPTEERVYLNPPVDIYECDDCLVIEADMPGVSKDSLTVKVEGNTLTIEGKSQPLVEQGEILRQEFEWGDYFRSFTLPYQIDIDKISADLNLGVLKVVLPKLPEAQPKKIEVKVQ